MGRLAPNSHAEIVSDGDDFVAADVGRHRAGARMSSLKDVAELLGISLSTLRRRVGDGTLRVHRIGRTVRVSEADLAAFLASSRGEHT